MVEVVPARTSPTLLPHPLALCCDHPVSECPSASIVMTSTVRVKLELQQLKTAEPASSAKINPTAADLVKDDEINQTLQGINSYSASHDN